MSRSIRSSRFSFRSFPSSSRSALVRTPGLPLPRSARARSTQLRSADAVRSRSRATCGIVVPSSRTRRTAPALVLIREAPPRPLLLPTVARSVLHPGHHIALSCGVHGTGSGPLSETRRVRRASWYICGLEFRLKKLVGRNCLRWEQGIRSPGLGQHFTPAYSWTVFFFTFVAALSAFLGFICLAKELSARTIDYEALSYGTGAVVAVVIFLVFFLRGKKEADWLISTYNTIPAEEQETKEEAPNAPRGVSA